MRFVVRSIFAFLFVAVLSAACADATTPPDVFLNAYPGGLDVDVDGDWCGPGPDGGVFFFRIALRGDISDVEPGSLIANSSEWSFTSNPSGPVSTWIVTGTLVPAGDGIEISAGHLLEVKGCDWAVIDSTYSGVPLSFFEASCYTTVAGGLTLEGYATVPCDSPKTVETSPLSWSRLKELFH